MDLGKTRVPWGVSKILRIGALVSVYGHREACLVHIVRTLALVFVLMGMVTGGPWAREAREGPSRPLLMQVLEANSLKEAEGLMARLKDGEPFAQLARDHAPEALRERSGYVGVVRGESLDPVVRKALSKRGPGDISGPIEVRGQFLIVRLLSPEEAASFEAARGSGQYYLELGLILGEMAEHDREIDAYREAIELSPDMKEAHLNLGEALRQKAMRVVGQLSREGVPSSGSLEEVVAILDDAIDQFKLALSLDPGFAEAHYDLGLVYAAEGLLDLALMEFEEAVRSRPEDGEMEKSVASTYLLKGDYAAATIHAERAKALGADVREVLLLIEKGKSRRKVPSERTRLPAKTERSR